MPGEIPQISVVIPTLNEESFLPQTILALQGTESCEIIIVDGGSQDRTCEIAEAAGCRVLSSRRGRGVQFNRGAAEAKGQTLLFLHADTRLPPAFAETIRSALASPKVVGGAFQLKIDAPGWPLRMIERGVWLRSNLLRLPYGDQAFFISSEAFQRLGGFAPIPLLEDVDFVRRLRRVGRLKMVSTAVQTSGRRWLNLGPWRTTWINQKVMLGYLLGLSPAQLAPWYNGHPATCTGTAPTQPRQGSDRTVANGAITDDSVVLADKT